jgi:CHAT domain-containing protein
VDYQRAEAIVSAERPATQNSIAGLLELSRGENGIGWIDLPGTRSEIGSVQDSYSSFLGLPAGSDLIVSLRQQHATEERFVELAKEFKFIHVATHGFFAPALVPSRKPNESAGFEQGKLDAMMANLTEYSRKIKGLSPGQLSGLVFAGANQSTADLQNDGYLTADEIAYLTLSGTEMVVLSACETGLGEFAGGEGLLGLQRAFQVAGARTVVATLWSVDDRYARELMQKFYGKLLDPDKNKRSPTRLDALRDAQLELLRGATKQRGGDDSNATAESQRLSPRHWAPFVMSGDWR